MTLRDPYRRSRSGEEEADDCRAPRSRADRWMSHTLGTHLCRQRADPFIHAYPPHSGNYRDWTGAGPFQDSGRQPRTDGNSRKTYGATLGVLKTMQGIGNAVGVAILEIPFSAALHRGRESGATLVQSYTSAFGAVTLWLAGVFIVVVILLRLLP